MAKYFLSLTKEVIISNKHKYKLIGEAYRKYFFILSIIPTIAAALNLIVFLGNLGLIIVFVIGGIFLYKFLPDAFLCTKNYLGEYLNLDMLQYLHPKVVKIGIAGKASVGKTTLANEIASIDDNVVRTEKSSALISSTNTSPNFYIAILDGPGAEPLEQLNILSYSEILIVVLDHNLDETKNHLDKDRLKTQLEFVEDLAITMKSKNAIPKKIIMLLNKKDLWIQLQDDDVIFIRKWFDSVSEKWSEHQIGCQVSKFEHSTINPENNRILRKELKLKKWTL